MGLAERFFEEPTLIVLKGMNKWPQAIDEMKGQVEYSIADT